MTATPTKEYVLGKLLAASKWNEEAETQVRQHLETHGRQMLENEEVWYVWGQRGSIDSIPFVTQLVQNNETYLRHNPSFLIHVAVGEDNFPLVQALLATGLNPEASAPGIFRGNNAFFYALLSQEKKVAILRALHDHTGRHDYRTEDGSDLLMYFLEKCPLSMEVLEELITWGNWDFERQNDRGKNIWTCAADCDGEIFDRLAQVHPPNY